MRQTYDLRVWCCTCSEALGTLDAIERGQGIGTSTGFMVRMQKAGTFTGIESLLRNAVLNHEATPQHRRALAARTGKESTP